MNYRRVQARPRSLSRSSTPRIKSVPRRLRCAHDLMGRIYHWLLHHAKYLGTYYTSVSAATLLLKVALDLKWSNVRTAERN